MFAFLTALNGPRTGSNFLLAAERENRIGRDNDCAVVLTDPLCSRTHAIIIRDADGWWVRDSGSRNGTFLNNQKIDEARLIDGFQLRMGSSEFAFQERDQRPKEFAQPDLSQSRTHFFDNPLVQTGALGDSSDDVAWLPDDEDSHDFLVVVQLCIRLLGCSDPSEVMAVSLSVVQQMTGASVSAFLWTSGDGGLKVKAVEPAEAAGRVITADSVGELVCRRRQAIWLRSPTDDRPPAALAQLADAICLPILPPKSPPGVLHLYRDDGPFDKKHFQFAQSVARIVVAALTSVHQQSLLREENRRLMDKSGHFDELIGECPPMLRLKEMITRVARATGCLLIRGESGAGKELVARAVHRLGGRADRPLLSVNCAAIPRDLIESQLFGYQRGAFTGADKDHAGWFEQADSGTLFLDEIGELTLEGQAKLLRVLDGHPFLPVGGNREIHVDVRVIAATNRDLAEFVRAKRFREDLFYRLSVFELIVPPLRDRGSDIGLLIDRFLDHFRREHGRPRLLLSAAARQKLLTYPWPGNVRQLRNALDSAVVLATGEDIQAEDLALRDAGGDFTSLRLDDWEKRLINEALQRSQDNVLEAAKLLGISRATMYRKLEEYGIVR